MTIHGTQSNQYPFEHSIYLRPLLPLLPSPCPQHALSTFCELTTILLFYFSSPSFPPSLPSFLNMHQFVSVSVCLSIFPVLRTTNRIGVLHVQTLPVISYFLQFEDMLEDSTQNERQTTRETKNSIHMYFISYSPSILPLFYSIPTSCATPYSIN